MTNKQNAKNNKAVSAQEHFVGKTLEELYAIRRDAQQFEALTQPQQDWLENRLESDRKAYVKYLQRDVEVKDLETTQLTLTRDRLKAQYEIGELHVALARQRADQERIQKEYAEQLEKIKAGDQLLQENSPEAAAQASAILTPDIPSDPDGRSEPVREDEETDMVHQLQGAVAEYLATNTEPAEESGNGGYMDESAALGN